MALPKSSKLTNTDELVARQHPTGSRFEYYCSGYRSPYRHGLVHQMR
ncbi:MAG: hypothetical protein VYE00_15280 [Candidatus Poribacteria bacterium]|nr:hypothetical protein [Candidatus Poribacteria bacterium]